MEADLPVGARNELAGNSGSSVQAGSIGSVNFSVHPDSGKPGLVSVRPPARPGYAVHGRDELVSSLTEAVRAGLGPIVVHGAGGYGKTTVALRVVENVRDDTVVWWVDASSEVSLTGGLHEVVMKAGAHPDVVQRVWAGRGSAPDLLWEHLERLDQPWLLVLDGADDPRLLASANKRVSERTGWLREPSGRGAVLVTTREGGAATWGASAILSAVGALDAYTGAKVLLDRAPNAGGPAEAERLSERFGGLPLALHSAGSYLAAASEEPAVPGLNRPEDFAGYRAALDDGLIELIDAQESVEPRPDRELLGRTWELSLDLLAERDQPMARPLLRMLSWMAPQPIPYELLNSEVLGESSLFVGLTPKRLSMLIQKLRELNLVDSVKVPDLQDEVSVLVLHPVMRETNREQADVVGQYCTYADLLLRLLMRVTGSSNFFEPANWPLWRTLLPHVGHVRHFVGANDEQRLAVATVCHRAAVFCRSAGMVYEAYELCLAAMHHREELLGVDHPTTLSTRHHVAVTLRERGELATAKAEFRAVLKARARVLGAEHESTLSSWHGLAVTLQRGGDAKGAEEDFRAVFDARSRVLGAEHPDTLSTRHGLAIVLQDLGDWERSETEFGELLKIRSEVLGKEHPSTLGTRHGRAIVLRERGAWGPAAAEFKMVLDTRSRLLGVDHPDTLNTRQGLAFVLRASGEALAAKAEFLEIFDARQRVLGPDHPDTVRTRQALHSLRHV